MKGITALILAAIIMVSASSASIAYYSPLHSVVYPAAHVYRAHSSSVLTPSQHQYHTQDEFGQYAYGYSEPLSAKQEMRALDGTTRGSYSYRDADGKLQMVAYTADDNGFHVAATNLPRAVPTPDQSNPIQASASGSESGSSATPDSIADSLEVTAARQGHFAAHQTSKLHLESSESTPANNGARLFSTATSNVRSVEVPIPVDDTPAVALAKAEHLKRFEHEKLRNEIIAASASPSGALVRPIIPRVYSYGFPISTRLIASGYYF